MVSKPIIDSSRDYLVSLREEHKSKKQSNVSHSSTKVEYQALAALTCELRWLFFLFRDL